jgi:hypothetical protein
MEDFFADLYDDDDKEKEGEPSFSLYEFKKWLAKENRKKRAEKTAEKTVGDDVKKDELKNKFKQKIRDKINKKKKS